MPVLPPGLWTASQLGYDPTEDYPRPGVPVTPGIAPPPTNAGPGISGLKNRYDLMLDKLQSENPSDAVRLLNTLSGRTNPPLQAQLSIMPGGPGRILQNPGASAVSITPELVAAAKAGDETAVAKVIDGLQGMIRKVASKYAQQGKPTMEMPDLIMEGHEAAMQVLRSPSSPDAFLPYVRGAVENRIQNFIRGESRAARPGALAETVPGLEDIKARIPAVPRSTMNDIMNSAMGKLPEQQRQLIEMRLGLGETAPEGMSIERLAEMRGVTPQAIRKQLAKATDAMHEELKSAGIDLTDVRPETEMPPVAGHETRAASEGGVPPISGGGPGLSDLQNIMKKAEAAKQSFEAVKPRVEQTLTKMEGLAKGTPGEEGLRSVVHEAGAVYEGTQVMDMDLPELGIKSGDRVIYYTDPVTGSTNFVGEHQLSRNNLMDLLSKSRAEHVEAGGTMPSPEEVQQMIEGKHRQMPPIGGGSVEEPTELGYGLASTLKQQGQAGGYKSPYSTRVELPYEPEYQPSDFARPNGPDGITGDGNGGIRHAGDLSELYDLRHDPEAVNRFILELQKYLPPER